jgi:hypothetical protein
MWKLNFIWKGRQPSFQRTVFAKNNPVRWQRKRKFIKVNELKRAFKGQRTHMILNAFFKDFIIRSLAVQT